MSSITMKHYNLINLVLLVFFQTSLSKRYDDYKMYRITPVTNEELFLFNKLRHDSSMGIDFWTEPGSLNHPIDMVVAPHKQDRFLKKVNSMGIKAIEVLNNVQEAFVEQKVAPYTRRNLKSFNWNNYYSLEDIYAWLKDITTARKDKATLVNMGKSAEGRDILGVFFKCQGSSCNSIFIEGGIHAREWISHAFVTYLISELAHAKTTEIKMALTQYSWHIFPVVNPDGYVYTHNQDQGWRKNRRRLSSGDIGVDLNRNFDYKFGTLGDSREESDESYSGPSAFSEPESRAIADYINTTAHNLAFYLSFHSYGQFMILPYGDETTHKENFDEVKDLGELALKKLKSFYNTTYKIGICEETIGYRVTGSSVDWVKREYQVPVAAYIELRDNGKYGFALPAVYILPTCRETMAFVLEMVKQSNAPNSLRTRFMSRTSSAKETCESSYLIFVAVVTLILN